MIGRLSGVLVEATEIAIIDVNGVGYEVHMTARDLSALPMGEPATVVIETVVREDMIRLFGFREAAGRDWFRLLQGVQGVGAKVALAVLNVLPPDALAAAVASGDRTAIARAPGVGKRVAERIATELRGKAPTMPAPLVVPEVASSAVDHHVADAISALTNLGYDENLARSTVTALAKDQPEAPAAQLIRAGLKALAA